MCKGMYERIKNGIKKHPVWTIVILIITMLLGASTMLQLIDSVDGWDVTKWIDGTPFFQTRLDGGVEAWFSFWGGYLGVVMTVVVAAITLIINFKIEDFNMENALNEQANTLHQLKIMSVKIYDMKECYPYNVLQYFKKESNEIRYFIKIKFKKPLPPYFKLDFLGFDWGKINSKEKDIVIEKRGNKSRKKRCKQQENITILNKKQWHILQRGKLAIILPVFKNENEIIDDINKFCNLNHFEPNIMPEEERKRRVSIMFRFHNELFEAYNVKSQNKGYYVYGIEMDNFDNYEKEYVSLSVYNTYLKYKRV